MININGKQYKGNSVSIINDVTTKNGNVTVAGYIGGDVENKNGNIKHI